MVFSALSLLSKLQDLMSSEFRDLHRTEGTAKPHDGLKVSGYIIPYIAQSNRQRFLEGLPDSTAIFESSFSATNDKYRAVRLKDHRNCAELSPQLGSGQETSFPRAAISAESQCLSHSEFKEMPGSRWRVVILFAQLLCRIVNSIFSSHLTLPLFISWLATTSASTPPKKAPPKLLVWLLPLE
ncbi:hypothetical protein BDZ45DRAFT_405685 [Acephala macrosclerotiorum]|nr:hypothetical protein BDZ45DRAFT_405685 [Acephala macrosclerotiorum]